MFAKISTTTRLPVRLLDASGNPVTGMGSANILNGVITIVATDGSTADITVVNNTNWYEISSTKAPGLYHFALPAANIGTVGEYQFAVLPQAALTFNASVSTVTVDYRVDDVNTSTSTLLTRIGTPVSSIAADIAEVEGETDAIIATLGTPETSINGALNGIQSDVTTILSNIGSPESGDLATDIANVNTQVGSLIGIAGSISSDVGVLKNGMFGKWEIVTTGPDANRLVMYDQAGLEMLKFDLVDSADVPTTTSVFKRTPVDGPI